MLKLNSIIVHSFGDCQKWELAGCIGDFENFLTISLKAHACFHRPEYLMSEIGIAKIVKYCNLSEVCMIKTAPQSTVSPQMWCIKSIKGWLTRPQICWQVNLSNPKNSAWFNRFLGLIYCYQYPLCVLKVIEDGCNFFVCAYEAINSM